MNDSNQNAKGLSRRDFIRIGSTGAAGLALADLGSLNVSAADSTGKLPLRRYGRTGLQISALVGASDWSPDVIPMAVAAGVNYWHKAHHWNAQNMPDALKSQPRESYYLEVVVDRVDGDNAHGRIDEEQHYQFVKKCVADSGVGYYDVMKFHFGYHSLNEAKTDLGMVRAYQRLKNEGLVKHFAISQHHYKNIGGDMAYEILPYVMDNLPYEAAQFFYTYGDKQEISDLIALAKQKDFGAIAMKTMGGVGRASTDPKFQTMLAEPRFNGSTPGAAMVKWLMSNPNLTAAVIATKNFDQLQENLGAAQQSALVSEDRETLGLLAAYNKGMTCLLCSDCVSRCPEHIAIADIFRYERYALDYHELSRARAEYKTLTKNGSACIACGDCVPVCQADINIAAKLKDVHNLLG
ncbi:MAG: aldo/keto reductase [Methylacidiphilales bacterium]|nr:aldo/keto reductase [Candidatus Methylacidiphilales bacterium]